VYKGDYQAVRAKMQVHIAGKHLRHKRSGAYTVANHLFGVIMSQEISIDIIRKMGAEIKELSKNRIVVEMPLEPNLNHVGMMYAGSLFTLAEFPMGVLCLQNMDMTKVFPVVGEVNIRFKKPVFSAATLTLEVAPEEFARLENEALENGKSQMIVKQEIKDTSGDVVAETSGTYFCIKAP
jgi:thioesterase domain-containing protein